MQAPRNEPGERRRRGLAAAVRRWFRRPTAPPEPVAPLARSPSSAIEPDARIRLLVDEWKVICACLRADQARDLAHLCAFLASSALVCGAYLMLAGGGAPWRLGRWALPGAGIAVALLFLALECGSQAQQSTRVRRGRQIEAVVQVLMPGIGHMRTLGLLGDELAEAGRGFRNGAFPRIGAYALLLLASLAALTAALAGWRAELV